MQIIKLLGETSQKLGRTMGVADGLARELKRFIDHGGNVPEAEHVLYVWAEWVKKVSSDDLK